MSTKARNPSRIQVVHELEHEQPCNILKSLFGMQQGLAARVCHTFLRWEAWSLATLLGRQHVVHLLPEVLPQLLKLGQSHPRQQPRTQACRRVWLSFSTPCGRHITHVMTVTVAIQMHPMYDPVACFKDSHFVTHNGFKSHLVADYEFLLVSLAMPTERVQSQVGPGGKKVTLRH